MLYKIWGVLYAYWGAPQSQLLIFLIAVIVELSRGVVEHLIFYSVGEKTACMGIRLNLSSLSAWSMLSFDEAVVG